MLNQGTSNKQQKDISEIDLFTQWHNKALNYIAGIFIFVFILFWLWNTDSFLKVPKGPDLGDTFNIFNALMTAITIIFVYGAYRLQLEVYQLQKKELEETRKVFKEQEEEMREQKEIMKEEKFYNQLRFLLEQKELLKQKIQIKKSDVILRGESAMVMIETEIMELLYPMYGEYTTTYSIEDLNGIILEQINQITDYKKTVQLLKRKINENLYGEARDELLFLAESNLDKNFLRSCEELRRSL